MKKVAFAALCIATLIYVLCVSQITGESDPYRFNLPRFLAWLLYLPSLVAAILGLGTALITALSKKEFREKAFYAVCGFFCLPMIAYYAFHPEYIYDKREHWEGRLTADFNSSQSTLLPELIHYYQLNPEGFHRTGEADIVIVDGFADYIRNSNLDLRWYDDWGAPVDSIQTSGSDVLAPWGAPILFLLNTSGDGYIQFPEKNQTVNEYADPWQKPGFTYKFAVGATVRQAPPFRNSAIPAVVLNDSEYNRVLRDKTLNTLNSLRTAISQYELLFENAPLPSDNSELLRILGGDNPKKIGFIGAFDKRRVNSKGEVLDDWGTPLHFDTTDPKTPLIKSAGQDMIWNTSDDLLNDKSP